MKLAALVLLTGVIALAQPAPQFDVVSVRPWQRGMAVSAGVKCPNGQFAAIYQPVWQIIDWAYQTEIYQLFGLPQWAGFSGDSFNVEARAPADTTEEQCRAMARSMLADRFKLVVHREMRNLPAFEMTVRKGGIKMKPVTPSDEGLGIHIKIDGGELQGAPGSQVKPPVGWSMAQLINILEFVTMPAAGERRKPIIDKTGLQGLYKFNLEMGSTMMGRPVQEGFSDPFTAVKEQLGLEIKPVTEPFEVLVVDRIEHPDPN